MAVAKNPENLIKLERPLPELVAGEKSRNFSLGETEAGGVLHSRGKGRGSSRTRAKTRRQKSALLSAEEKLLNIYADIAFYAQEPVVFLDLPWGLLVVRPNVTKTAQQIKPATNRIGHTIFGTPQSVRDAQLTLSGAYRRSARFSGQTFSDIRATAAADFLGGIMGRRFQKPIRRDENGESVSLISAIAYIFELSDIPPYPAIIVRVEPDGSPDVVPPGIEWPPVPVQLAPHIERFEREYMRAVLGVRDHIDFLARHEPLQPEMHLVFPFVAAVGRTLREHFAQMVQSDKTHQPLSLDVEAVYLSRSAVTNAKLQEAEGLSGDYMDVWNQIGEEAEIFYAYWLKRIEELKAKANDPSGQPPGDGAPVADPPGDHPADPPDFVPPAS